MKTNITRMVKVAKQKRRAAQTPIQISARRARLHHLGGIHKSCDPTNCNVAYFQHQAARKMWM